MSFGGLILTNHGRNELAKAELGSPYSISGVVLGDGRYDGSYVAIESVVSPVMQLPIKKMTRNEGEVTIETEFNSQDIPRAFYLREVGILANGKLCYYDNSRDDAEFLDPGSEAIIKQKRMRFVLLISATAEVSATITSGLYALDTDLQEQATQQKKALEDAISDARSYADGTYRQSTSYTDQKISDLIGGAPETLDTLREIADEIAKDNGVVDALDAAIGKKADQTELDTHVGNDTIHVTQADKNKWNNKMEKTGSSNDNSTTFSEAQSRENIKSGEKHSVIFGKIAKWLADLKNVAFSGSYKDLSDKPSIPNEVEVKGAMESAYRTGKVNLTAENIGAPDASKKGKTYSSIAAFAEDLGKTTLPVIGNCKTAGFGPDGEGWYYYCLQAQNAYPSTGMDLKGFMIKHSDTKIMFVRILSGTSPKFEILATLSGTNTGNQTIPTSLPANGGTASNVSGTVAIKNGGTGATDAAKARENLGITLKNLGINVAADMINYLSGLTGNVQSQINSLNTGLTNCSNMFSGFLATKTASAAYSVGVGAGYTVNFTDVTPANYVYVGVVGFYAGNVGIYVVRVTKNRMDIRNDSVNTINGTAEITMLYMKK